MCLDEVSMTIADGCTIQAVTSQPGHHFFGYYNVCPWDATGRYMVALETDFCNRPPGRNDVARIGLIDTHEDNSWKPLAETTVWSWQQGCMLQWLPSQPDRHIVYNDVRDGKLVAIIRDVFSGESRQLPRPIYAMSPDGRHALSLNFARLQRTRPGYGYAGVADPTVGKMAPDDDGIYWMDMESGESKLIISIRQLAETHPAPSMRGAEHWVIHMDFNTDGSRFAFYHRWEARLTWMQRQCRRVGRKLLRVFSPGRKFGPNRVTRMLTARPDGSDLRILSDDGMVSHFFWKDSDHLLAWAFVKDRGAHYYLFDDSTGQAEIVGRDVLTRDGHPSYSPDRKWFVSDTYPDAQTGCRTLLLYRVADGARFDIGQFLSPSEISGEIRCDLHPRWNRDGTQVCFDSVHEGTRQLYVADLTELVRAEV